MSETGDSLVKAEAHGRMVLLSDLRVFELKQELEKRGLDRNGIKLALVERLEAALREEGHNPQDFLFCINDYGKSSTPAKTGIATDLTGVSKEADGSKMGEVAEATLVEKAANRDVQGIVGEDHALFVDDGIGEGEKPMIELDDEDGKNDVDTEGEPEDPEADLEPGPEMEPEPELEAEVEPEPEQEGDKALTEQAVEVESVEAAQKQLKKVDTPAETVEKEDVDEKKADGEMEEAAKEGRKERGKMEGTDEEEKDREHAGEETKKSSAKAHIVSSSKTASTIKKTSNSLWIKGLGSETKAADLKAMFAKCGRVVTAKIFTRRQQPSSTCFGFVTMVDTGAAEECIRLFNKTHINGHLVTVERADHSSMPAVKSTQKKNATLTSTANSTATKIKDSAKNGDKVSEKRKGEPKTDKSEKQSEKKSSEETKSTSITKTTPKTKKSPIEAPARMDSEKARSSREASSSKPTAHRQRSPPVFRKGRRVFERPAMHRTLRGGVVSRKPARIALATRGSYRGSFASNRARGGRASGRILMSTRGRPLVSSVSRYERGRGSSMHHPPPISGRLGRSSMYDSSYRDMPRHSGESVSWERREMMSLMRRREEEFRLKEEELKLQRERERIKFERERIERERLELEQLRQVAAMSGAMGGSALTSMTMSSSRRSHGGGYEDMDMSSGRRGDSRAGGDRPSSRHVAAYGRGERRESSHDDMRTRAHAHRPDTERERDRSRHVIRDTYDYGSSGMSGGREYDRHRRSDSYGRRGESTRGSVSSYGGGHYGGSSRVGASGGEMSGGWAAAMGAGGGGGGGGGMSTGDAYTDSSSRDYGTRQGSWVQSSASAHIQAGPGGGSAAWRSSQQHSGGDWSTGSSSGYAGSHGGTHSSSYEKPYQKTYDKYDTYTTNKYSSRRY